MDAENAEKIAKGISPSETKFETVLGSLRTAISKTMADSVDMKEFQQKLFENYEISVHESRGRLSYLIPDRAKAVSARKLGTDFDKKFLEAYFRTAQKQLPVEISAQSDHFHTGRPWSSHPSSIRLVVDLQKCAKAQENKYYAQKVKVGNLQQLAKTMAFLQENGIGTPEELAALLAATQIDQQEKHKALLATEKRLKTVNQLIHYIGQYLANKKVFAAYMKTKGIFDTHMNQKFFSMRLRERP